MTVTIIIPTLFNKTLPKTIESIINNTRQPDQIFLVTDGNCSQNRNKGILQCDTDYIMFTDDDCILDKNCIEEGLKVLETMPLDYMQGKVEGGIQTSHKKIFVGANLWVKTSVAKKHLFDEYLKYHQDLEWGWRLRKEGYNFGYHDRAIVHHPTLGKAESMNVKIREEFLEWFFENYPKETKKLLEEDDAT